MRVSRQLNNFAFHRETPRVRMLRCNTFARCTLPHGRRACALVNATDNNLLQKN
jgi:hypothetical protein